MTAIKQNFLIICKCNNEGIELVRTKGKNNGKGSVKGKRHQDTYATKKKSVRSSKLKENKGKVRTYLTRVIAFYKMYIILLVE